MVCIFYVQFSLLSLQACKLFLDPNTTVEITDLTHPSTPHHTTAGVIFNRC